MPQLVWVGLWTAAAERAVLTRRWSADSLRWSTTCRPPRGLVRPVRVDPGMWPVRRRVRPEGRAGAARRGAGMCRPRSRTAPEQRAMEQSARLPSQGAVTGWAALRLAGASFFDGVEPDGRTRIPVLLAVGARSKARGDEGASVSRTGAGHGRCFVRWVARASSAGHRTSRGCDWCGWWMPGCRRRWSTGRCSCAGAGSSGWRISSTRWPVWSASTTAPTLDQLLAEKAALRALQESADAS